MCAAFGYGAAMTRSQFLLALGSMSVLAGCGPGENDPGPGGVTVGEAQELDEAAAMLESQKLPAEALDNPPAPPQGEAQEQAEE